MRVTNCFGSKYYSSQQLLENILLKKSRRNIWLFTITYFRSANILAYWVGKDGNIHDLNKIDLRPRAGEIKFFLQQTVYKDNQEFTFI